MTTKFHTTNNARWFAVRPPSSSSEPNSERVWLYQTILQSPGITADDIDLQWPFKHTNMRSRLKELLDKGCIRNERITDIFA